MKSFFLILFSLVLNATMYGQFSCTDLFYDEDSVIVVNDEPYTGYCDYRDEKGNLDSRYYYSYGDLDSVAFYRHNGLIEYMDPYVEGKLQGLARRYDKKGRLKQTKTFRKGKEEGLYREYDPQGRVRYEADYTSDGELKNDTYYTWTKKGVKYKHSCLYTEKAIHFGKLISYSGRRKCRKTRVTG